MRKQTATFLNKMAEQLPVIFNPIPIEIEMTGEDLNLSAYGETQRFVPTAIYKIPFVEFRAVEHKQQIKDAYRQNGEQGAIDYVNNVMNQYKNNLQCVN